MTKNLILMNKDNIVMNINFDEGIYEVKDDMLLPFQLKGKIQEVPPITDGMSRYEITQSIIASNKNRDAVTRFFSSRVLPLTRENAKKLYSLFHFEQLQSDYEKSMIAISCRAVSLQDNYWVRQEGENIKWSDVDIRQNPLNEIVAQVSLHGRSLTLQGEAHTPEMNGQGAYAKAWKRENNELVLYKLGTKIKGDIESQIEVMVSNLLDKTNVEHLHYELKETEGRKASVCSCMTSEDVSILSGLDFISYCNANQLDVEKSISSLYGGSEIYKMWIVDYLISNPDRHGMNWGFFYDANRMEITGLHPLFDHNNAFDEELMKVEDSPYIFSNGMTMKESALYGIKHSDFKITEPIFRSDFLTDEQYESFCGKAKAIGLDLTINKDLDSDMDSDDLFDRF